MWEDSMAAEGWALYAEGLVAEPQQGAPEGFYLPEERLYQLKGLLYRNLRVRIDTGLHTGKLGFDDAVTLFSEVVDFLPGSCSDAKVLRQPAKRASCDSRAGGGESVFALADAGDYVSHREGSDPRASRAGAAGAGRQVLRAAIPPGVHEAGDDRGGLLRR